MAKRDNHYEAAFEAYLRRRRTPYVAVDEARRSPLADGSLKSLDFIVSPPAAPGGDQMSWLVDVKGRRFPSGRQKKYWKNWLTRDDLRSMAEWERLFGPQFGGLYVFAYNIVGDRCPAPAESVFEFRSRLYAFVAIRFVDYARLWRPLSSRWDTVAIRTRWFRAWALPFDALIDGTPINRAPTDSSPAAYGRLEYARPDALRIGAARLGSVRCDAAPAGASFPETPDDAMCDPFTPAGW